MKQWLNEFLFGFCAWLAIFKSYFTNFDYHAALNNLCPRFNISTRYITLPMWIGHFSSFTLLLTPIVILTAYLTT